MPPGGSTNLDVLIFGGGAAGLWLLDNLVRRGHKTLLLESAYLGAGQTVASQGIIHGGLKYTLSGLLTPSARAIREMPVLWRRCLAGERAPNLSNTRLRSQFCYLWQTKTLSSRVAMIGARAGLRIAPEKLETNARPEVLRRCPGVVARIDEQVIEPDSFLADLAGQHNDNLLSIHLASGAEFETSAPGQVDRVRLINPDTGEPLDVKPRHVVFTAGAGNAELLRRAGIESEIMQRRPLHMVAARGKLPTLNAHCVDGMHTRATITTTRDYADHTIWQIGGQIAEDGVEMDREALIRHARTELQTILPGISLDSVEWTTYKVDRAEAVTKGGRRPAEARITKKCNTICGWPTKMALAPQLAEQIIKLLPEPDVSNQIDIDVLSRWPKPAVAVPPWEENPKWSTVD